MRLGLLTILVGVLFLFKNLNLIPADQWSIFWPVIVIYLGIAMLARKRCWHCRAWHDDMYIGKKGRCSCENCEECSERKAR